MAASSGSPLGQPLFMEHLPFPMLATGLSQAGGCVDGVLLIIYDSGAACFCRLTDRTVTSNPAKCSYSRLLTPDRPRMPRGDRSEAHKYQVYETSVDAEEVVHVHTFPFLPLAGSPQAAFRAPKKIALSADRRLLLFFGIQHKGQSCVVVYHILDHGPERFRIIFFDLTLTMHSACFTPDSRGILVVPRAYPGFVFLVRLPRVADDPAIVGPATMPGTAGRQPRAKNIEFEPRIAGPLCLLGPTIGTLGTTLKITHIAADDCTLQSSSGDAGSAVAHSKSYFSFVTWNDEEMGEFCVWTVQLLPSGQLVYSWEPRLLYPIPDVKWLLEADTPKQRILECQFCERGEFLGIMVQRRQFPRSAHNGIGLCMVTALPASWDMMGGGSADAGGWYYKTKTKRRTVGNVNVETARSVDVASAAAAMVAEEVANLAGTFQPPSSSGGAAQYGEFGALGPPLFCAAPCWYKVADEGSDASAISCLKWTDTLVLGTLPSFAVVVKGVGLFEMVEYMFGTAFQELLDDFSTSVCNFVQIGKYHRFWISTSGAIKCFVATPLVPASHPEWADLFACNQAEIMERRIMGRRFGYFISNVEADAPATLLQQLYSQAKGRVGRRDAKGGKGGGKGAAEATDMVIAGSNKECARMTGVHLYKCWSCKRFLLKPLQCSKCKSVAYCSQYCQKLHWPLHQQVCTESGLFFPHKTIN